MALSRHYDTPFLFLKYYISHYGLRGSIIKGITGFS